MVLNTPRTLGEILPTLMQRIIVALAASGADQRTGASRCLGELVRKLAERVLPSIVPILQEGLKHPDGDTRQARYTCHRPFCLHLTLVAGAGCNHRAVRSAEQCHA